MPEKPQPADQSAAETPEHPEGTQGERGLPAEPATHHLEEGWEPGDSVPAKEAAEALQAAEDRFLRLAAEYDNYRKRTTREKGEAFDRGASDLISRLLDELDDVDRLLDSDPEQTDYAAYRDGFALFAKKLGKELGNAGLERLEPNGEPFDPNQHEAVSVLPTDDAAKDNVVAATFQVGYRFRGTIVRPARVQVWSVDGAI